MLLLWPFLRTEPQMGVQLGNEADIRGFVRRNGQATVTSDAI
jgi:hypothetical protein